MLFLFPSSPWQEEEDQAADAPSGPRQVEDHRSHSLVPRHHRFRRCQGCTPREGCPPGRWYPRSEETSG